MSAGQIVSVNRRISVPAAAVVLAATFLIGAVAGATALSVVSRTGQAGSVSASYAVLAAPRGDMSSAAYAALHPATAVLAAPRGDMSSAAYAALHPATAVLAAPRGDMSSAAYAALHPQETGGPGKQARRR